MARKKKSKGSPAISARQKLFIGLELTGTATLVQNCFNQKAIEQMLRKHMGLPVEQEKKIPAECIERAVIRNTEEVICIPPTALKKAILSASGPIKGLTKTVLRGQVFVQGGSIPIKYSRMVPRMDMVKLSGQSKVPDVRFRPEFEDWSARVIILFSEQLPVQTVIDLVDRAGDIGIGEWRPEKDGSHGTFEISRLIEDKKELAEIPRICRPPIKSLIIPEWAMNVELSADILSKLKNG